MMAKALNVQLTSEKSKSICIAIANRWSYGSIASDLIIGAGDEDITRFFVSDFKYQHWSPLLSDRYETLEPFKRHFYALHDIDIDKLPSSGPDRDTLDNLFELQYNKQQARAKSQAAQRAAAKNEDLGPKGLYQLFSYRRTTLRGDKFSKRVSNLIQTERAEGRPIDLSRPENWRKLAHASTTECGFFSRPGSSVLLSQIS